MTQPSSPIFRITGLDCAEEVAVLKREVGPVVGGEERLAFDVLNGRMIVTRAARRRAAAGDRRGGEAGGARCGTGRWQPADRRTAGDVLAIARSAGAHRR